MSYYLTLGVSETATPREITKAYHALAKKFHPDVNGDDPQAELKFKSISEAYNCLKDEIKRAQYDAAQRQPRGFNQNFNNRDPFDIIREHMWAQAESRIRNRDIALRYQITLEEAYTGKEVDLNFSAPNGPKQTVHVSIPPSVQSGTKIRFAGLGENTRPNVPPGDLYVQIEILPNQNFVRSWFDVGTTIYVDLIDAILGTNTDVECLDGTKTNVRVPAGITPGSHVVVPDKGFLKPNGTRGSMLVEIVLVQPKLTPEQLDMLVQLKLKAQN